jgi:hypothetical protein
MGLSPWATPVELWMRRPAARRAAEPDPRRQKMFDRGHKLEPFIRDMAIDKLRDEGLQVELLACNERYVDPEHPFLSCEIDFELAHRRRGDRRQASTSSMASTSTPTRRA